MLIPLLIVCTLAPGFFFLRKLHWAPLEKLCASIGLSLVLLYLAAFAIYLLEIQWWTCWLVTAICLALMIASRKDLAKLLAVSQIRRALLGFAVLLLWGLTMLSLVRHYSGGQWCLDWIEHFNRAKFFLEHLPAQHLFLDRYLLPARPPLISLVDAHFLAQVGTRFEYHQFILLFLGLLSFFPSCLLASALVKRGSRAIALLVVLLALNPLFIQNLTYSWTKLPACFFALLAIWLYLAALRKRDSLRMTCAFVSLSAAALSHYSVGPYIIFIVLHYLFLAFWQRRAKWRELGTLLLASALLLASWVGWSYQQYGFKGTFSSHTAMTVLTNQSKAQTADIALQNMYSTIIPHPLRIDSQTFKHMFAQQSQLGFLRDYTFLIYQVNIVFAMGSIGGLAVLYLLYLAFVRRKFSPITTKPPHRHNLVRKTPSERLFWMIFIPFTYILGIGIVSELDSFGFAHLCLATSVLLGVIFLAASFSLLPKALRWLIATGCVVDFAIGIFLHHYLQSTNFSLVFVNNRLIARASTGALLSARAFYNWADKISNHFSFLGDHHYMFIASLIALILAVLLWLRYRRAGKVNASRQRLNPIAKKKNRR